MIVQVLVLVTDYLYKVLALILVLVLMLKLLLSRSSQVSTRDIILWYTLRPQSKFYEDHISRNLKLVKKLVLVKKLILVLALAPQIINYVKIYLVCC